MYRLIIIVFTALLLILENKIDRELARSMIQNNSKRYERPSLGFTRGRGHTKAKIDGGKQVEICNFHVV